MPNSVNSIETFRDAVKKAAIQKYGQHRYVVDLADAAGWKATSLHTFFGRTPKRWPAADKVDGLRRALGGLLNHLRETGAEYRLGESAEVAALLELVRPNFERIARSPSPLRGPILDHLKYQVELLADALEPPAAPERQPARASPSSPLGRRGAPHRR